MKKRYSFFPHLRLYEMSKKDLRNWTRRVRCLFIQATISFLRNAWRTSASCSHCALKAWASVPSARLHVVVRLLCMCVFFWCEWDNNSETGESKSKQTINQIAVLVLFCLFVGFWLGARANSHRTNIANYWCWFSQIISVFLLNCTISM